MKCRSKGPKGTKGHIGRNKGDIRRAKQKATELTEHECNRPRFEAVQIWKRFEIGLL